MERLELLELAFSFCESVGFNSKKRSQALQPRLFCELFLNQCLALGGPGAESFCKQRRDC